MNDPIVDVSINGLKGILKLHEHTQTGLHLRQADRKDKMFVRDIKEWYTRCVKFLSDDQFEWLLASLLDLKWDDLLSQHIHQTMIS